MDSLITGSNCVTYSERLVRILTTGNLNDKNYTVVQFRNLFRHSLGTIPRKIM